MRWHHEELLHFAIHCGFNPTIFDFLNSGKQLLLTLVATSHLWQVNKVYLMGPFIDAGGLYLSCGTEWDTGEVEFTPRTEVLHKLRLAGTTSGVVEPVDGPIVGRLLYKFHDCLLEGQRSRHAGEVFEVVVNNLLGRVRRVVPRSVDAGVIFHNIKGKATLSNRIVRLWQECDIATIIDPLLEDGEKRLCLLRLRKDDTTLVVLFVGIVSLFELKAPLLAKLGEDRTHALRIRQRGVITRYGE